MNFLGLLTLVFIVLKLTGFIAWSWWLVLLPAYGIPLFFVLGAVIWGIKVVKKSKKQI